MFVDHLLDFFSLYLMMAECLSLKMRKIPMTISVRANVFKNRRKVIVTKVVGCYGFTSGCVEEKSVLEVFPGFQTVPLSSSASYCAFEQAVRIESTS